MLGSKSTTLESCIGHMKRVRYSMERFVFLPFSIAGCGSDSSIATGKSHQSREEAGSETKDPHGSRKDLAEQSKSGAKIGTYSASWSLPKPNIAARMQRFIRGIKSFSKIFAYKEEDEEEEMEMEIGFPTDVKHVTHIGLDGLTRNNVAKVLDEVRDPAEVNFMATISLDEYEMAMAAQTRPTLVV